MAKTLKMPVLGQSVEEVRLLRWLKNVGDAVAVGENLAEIETDKVATFFESPEAGIVRQILVPEDSFVAVEAPVIVLAATIDEPIGDDLPVASAPAADAAEDTAMHASPRARRAADEASISLSALAGRGSGPDGRIQEADVRAYIAECAATVPSVETDARSVKASPLARAVAGASGIDLSDVAGSGTGGRIRVDDVHNAIAPTVAVAPPAPADTAGKRTFTLSGMRKRVAENVHRSVQRAPHVTLHLSADMGAAMELRQTLIAAVEKRVGVRLSPTDIIVKAAAVALSEYPTLNAHIDGDTIVQFDAVHVGLAVSLGGDGLIVPVIRDAHRRSLAEIAASRQDLANRARANALTAVDIQGGTFTVSSLGNHGIEYFTPIVAPPQVAILGVGTIADAVVARNGVPVVRPVMGLSLSFDHRALDGTPAAAFLARLKEILETPTLLLL